MAKIMVVDDEPDIRTIVRTVLEKEGHEITEAESGEMCLKLEGHEITEAESGEMCLKLLSEYESPDILFLDVMMPGMDGWDVARKVKSDETLKDIIICMLTVKTSPDDILTSFESAKIEIVDWLLTVRGSLNWQSYHWTPSIEMRW
jgi:CheY-like chemotaxis protein